VSNEPDLSEFIDNENGEVARISKLLAGKVAEMMVRSGLDPQNAILRGLKMYQSTMKGEDGQPLVTDMISVDLAPEWADGPKWPVVQPSTKQPAMKFTYPKAEKTKELGYKQCVVMPDIQAGYYRDGDGQLVPIHDPDAIDVALQILAYVKPDLVIFVGDNLDAAEMGKYRLTPAFAQTTQPTIDYLNQLLIHVRKIVGPECEIRWLEGNHELRLSTYILDNAKAAFGLRKAGVPDSWPALSVPNLCNFDLHDVTYVPGYPANRTWINSRLQVIHGTHVVSNGSTAHKYLATERVSTVYGHIHRREWAERTRTGYDGPQTILAMSPGCLAKVTGEVPSTKGGFDLDGRPITSTEDWQQGLAVFTYEDHDDGFFIPEQVPIHDGWTIFRGKEFLSGGHGL
jgi:predicted phosphodiesterase